MKKMTAINIDKWRTLNVTLFNSYIETYNNLSKDNSLNPRKALVDAFSNNGIKMALTENDYGSAYTIARELGIYFESSNNYYLSKIAIKYINKQISYEDYLKFYCLNIEFNINNQVVHPFEEVIQAINNTNISKEVIAEKCPKLIPMGSPTSVIDCLRLFLNRCVEAKLLNFANGKYSLAYNYHLLKGSINKSSYDIITFNSLFIDGDSKVAQKNVVELLINREIPQLFIDPVKVDELNFTVNESIILENKDFSISHFTTKCNDSGLIFSPQLIQRFVASLCTKRFVICSGLSGSGKTKLAQAFAEWICETEEQYCLVPVGADWTNREPLLGFPNALNGKEYVKPENGVLDLIIKAKEYKNKPYFLILDEMNLSHVERYFADFLSTMESEDAIPLHNIDDEQKGIPKQIKLPKNLFIIGTVNIDETTYMFSPKVLDRANTIEFRLTTDDLEAFMNSTIPLNMDILRGRGADMGESFVEMAIQETDKNFKGSKEDLLLFFEELKKSGAEFGYRTASEIGRLMFMLESLGEAGDNLLDIAIMQKLLPKLHGSRNKLTKILPVLGGFCLLKKDKIKETYLDKFANNNLSEKELKEDKNIKYKISFEKICRMYKNAVENGFASYAEA